MSKKTNLDATTTLSQMEVAQAIEGVIATKRAMFLWGGPGISKSAVAAQVAKKLGMTFIDIRLSQMDPTDLRGIPFPTEENGNKGVRWSAPLVLPKDLDARGTVDALPEVTTVEFSNPFNVPVEDLKIAVNGYRLDGENMTVLEARVTDVTSTSFNVGLYNKDGNLSRGNVRWRVQGKVKALICLEEFNSAAQSVQAASYQLIHDRALGEYEVPEACKIIALGNRETDKGLTFRMPTPIANRFIHVEMRVEFDDWLIWAVESKLHEEVVGYLSQFRHKLNDFDPKTASRGFPTPRSWHMVSDYIYANPDAKEQIALAVLCGAVGDGTGIEFHAFRKNFRNMPNVGKILTGEIKKFEVEREVSMDYALVTAMCYRLKEFSEKVKREGNNPKDRKEWLAQADNFLLFTMENMKPEICIMGAKQAIAIHKLPFHTKEMVHFETFANKFKKLIMGLSIVALPMLTMLPSLLQGWF